MANNFIPVKQVLKEFSADLKKMRTSMTEKQWRAFIYDWQTRLGGFPYSAKERATFIRTGEYK